MVVAVVLAAVLNACTGANQGDSQQAATGAAAAPSTPPASPASPAPSAPSMPRSPQQAALAAYEEYTTAMVEALSSGEADLGRLYAVADDQA
ncbi:MAG TPA: hypothetical protein VK923_05225, partial [Euzebyales bacterium]|nr:hypothetical protein [Euzebyales bacterium]